MRAKLAFIGTFVIWPEQYMEHNMNYVFRRDKVTDMADKDIRKLRRSELIEIIYRLKKSEQELQLQIGALQSQLQDRTLKIENAGSLAEAALILSDVFTSAQTAADTYVEEVKRKYADTEAECEKMLSEAQQKADAIVQEATRQRDSVELQCKVSRAELQRVKKVLQELTGETTAGE